MAIARRGLEVNMQNCVCYTSSPYLLRYHGLRGVNGDWLCQWEMAIFDPPPESTPLERSPKNLVQVITSAASTTVPNLVQIRRWGASGQMGEI